ncbi:MAG: DsbA family protein [Candidatus Diapherotrites archaeon]|nr:DsbA family protein [Candidatus Diapherotrites archaeon]
MICLIALVVFAVLGIFSAKYRRLALEAFDCVFRRITFRKCNTSFDRKMKMRISAKILEKHEGLGRFVFKHFEALSWFFTLLMIASIALSAWGAYNFWAYGNCNGPDSSGFCIYNAAFGNGSSAAAPAPESLAVPTAIEGISLGNPDANETVFIFGCFSCPYTKKAWPATKQLIENYGGRVHFVWKFFPLENHPFSRPAAEIAACAAAQGKFIEFATALFDNQDEFRQKGIGFIFGLASKAGADEKKLRECYFAGNGSAIVDVTLAEGKKAGIYGTPTFFIGGKALVGESDFSVLDAAVAEALKKA